jgi:hypothetical protein
MNETTKMPRIYTDPSQSKATVEIVGDMDLLEEKLINMPNVTTDEQCELVGEYRAQFKAKARDLDKERKEMTAGARATVSMLNDKFNVIIERANRCTQLADNKLLPYMQERERQRKVAEKEARDAREKEEQAQRDAKQAIDDANKVAAETQDAEALADAEKKVTDAREGLDDLRRTPVARPEAKSVTGKLGSQIGMRQVWKYRITDFSKIPDEWLISEDERLHRGKLNTVAKRDQENAFVPGIEFYSEDTLASRPGVK